MQKLSEFLNKSFKYLIASLIIIVPLYPKFPFLQIPGTYVSIRIEDFLLAIIALVTLIRIIPNIKNLLKDNIVRAVIIFLVIGLVSLVSGILLTKTVVPGVGVFHFLRRIEYLIPFFAVLTFFPYEKGKNLEFYIKVLMIVVGAAFVYGLGQRYFDFPIIATQNSESSKGLALRWSPGSQIASTFAGHYDLAAFMVLVLPILISLIFTVKTKISRILLSLVSLSGFWLLVNSASRISLASYLFGVFISLLLLKKYKALFVVLTLSIILSGFSSSLAARYKSLIDTYLDVSAQEITLPVKKDPTPTPAPVVPVIEDRSTSIRLNVEWPRAIRAFLKSPLIGTGYSSIGLASDNDYLRLIAEVGFLGFIGFMLIITRILFVFASALPFDKNFSEVRLGFVAGVTGGIFGVLLNATFIDVFEASKFAIIFWLLVGLAVYTVKDKLNANKI